MIPEKFAVAVNESEALPETLPETAESESHAAVVLTLQFNFPFPELEMLTVRVNEVLSPSVAEKLRPVGLRLIVGFGPCAFPFPLPAKAGSDREVPESPPPLHPVSRGMQRTISRRPIDLIQRELHVKHPIAF